MAIEFAKDWLAAHQEEAELPSYELTTLVSEVNMLTRQTAQNLIAIGQRLSQIKAIVGHGNFGVYIRENCGYSQEAARRLMRIAEEYTPEAAPLGLGACKLYELLSLPAADRDEFIQTHDVENATVRELRAEIARVKAEKDEALNKERTESALVERGLRERIREGKLERDRLQSDLRESAEKIVRKEAEMARLNASLELADIQKRDLSAQLEAASHHEEDVNALVEAAADRKAKEVAIQFGARLAEANDKRIQAEEEAKALREQLETGDAPVSGVSLNSVTMLIGSMVTTLNALRDAISEGAWNAQWEVEQDWLDLAQLELSKVNGVLVNAQETIMRNVPEDEASE